MNKKQISSQERINMGQVQPQQQQQKLSKQSYKLLQTYQSLTIPIPQISIYSCMTPLISTIIFSKPPFSPPQLNRYCQSYIQKQKVSITKITHQQDEIVQEEDGFQIGDGEDKVEEMVSLGFKYVGSLWGKINRK